MKVVDDYYYMKSYYYYYYYGKSFIYIMEVQGADLG